MTQLAALGSPDASVESDGPAFAPFLQVRWRSSETLTAAQVETP